MELKKKRGSHQSKNTPEPLDDASFLHFPTEYKLEIFTINQPGHFRCYTRSASINVRQGGRPCRQQSSLRVQKNTTAYFKFKISLGIS
jgi:hypothetical protein